jgi:hypothetical protein
MSSSALATSLCSQTSMTPDRFHALRRTESPIMRRGLFHGVEPLLHLLPQLLAHPGRLAAPALIGTGGKLALRPPCR